MKKNKTPSKIPIFVLVAGLVISLIPVLIFTLSSLVDFRGYMSGEIISNKIAIISAFIGACCVGYYVYSRVTIASLGKIASGVVSGLVFYFVVFYLFVFAAIANAQ